MEIQCQEVAGTFLESTPPTIIIYSPNFPELNVTKKPLDFDGAEKEDIFENL